MGNPGTAPAGNITVTATLPSGTKFVSSAQGARYSPEQSQAVWTVPTVAAGGEVALDMLCDTSMPGISRLEVQCKGDGDLTASATSSTQVEALANLKLSVEDPTGPVLLDGEAAYQVHLDNRGSAAASNVEVVVYFSTHFEPMSAEGAHNRITPGQVVFERIPTIAAGQKMMLKIKAKADSPGSHVFRVEVRSDPAGTRLVREGTTRFYGSGSLPAQTTPAAPDSKSATPESRTADRGEAARQ